MKIEIATADDMVQTAVDCIIKSAQTGQIGDGKIFVSDMADVVRIRTGETGSEAL